MKLSAFIAGGLLAALLLAFFVSPRASSTPDGLEKVAVEEGFAATADAHALDDAPTAGYAVDGIGDEGLSTGVAGVIGVVVTFGLGVGVFMLVHRGRRRDAAHRSS